jgi:hypothetical protein
VREARHRASADVGDEGEKAVGDSEEIRRNGEADKKGTKSNKREKTEGKKNTTRNEVQEANAVLSRMKYRKRNRRTAPGGKVCGRESKPSTEVS